MKAIGGMELLLVLLGIISFTAAEQVKFVPVQEVELYSDDDPLPSDSRNGFEFSSVSDTVIRRTTKAVSRDKKSQDASCNSYCYKYYVTFNNGATTPVNLLRCVLVDEMRTFWIRKNDDETENYSIYYVQSAVDTSYAAYRGRLAYQQRYAA